MRWRACSADSTTSTRSSIPAPPPKGVSSTWPADNGVWSRKFTYPRREPAAIALRTWRCCSNHSNHSGKSVKMSISIARSPHAAAAGRRLLGDEVEVDLDAPLRDAHAADRIFDHRHEQLAAIGAGDLERLAGGVLDHACDHAHSARAVEHLTALQFVRPPLVLLQLRRRVAFDRQLHPAQRPRLLAILHALQTQDRMAGGARPPHHRGAAAADPDARARRQQTRGPRGHG